MSIQLTLAFLLAGSLVSLGGADNIIARRQSSCTDDESRNRNFAATYPQCASNLNAFTQPFEIPLRDLFCNSTCGPLYKTFFLAQCSSLVYQLLVEYYELQCNVNANGMPCYSFYNDSEIDRSVANSESLQLCSSSMPENNACSDACRNELTSIRNYYGSCVNSVFNSSYFRAGVDEPLLPLFSYQLWTKCGVPLPTQQGSGGGTTPAQVSPTSSATMSLTMFTVVFILINAVLGICLN